jgi:DnaJ-domain-containing protein 1
VYIGAFLKSALHVAYDRMRTAQILRGNFEVFMRRAHDENYGDKNDRVNALHDAIATDAEYMMLTGESLMEETHEKEIEGN